MAATTEKRDTEFKGQFPADQELTMTPSITLKAGTIVCLNGAVADVPADGRHALGIVVQTVTSTATGGEKVRYKPGIHRLLRDGARPNPGDRLYVLDNQTVTTVAGSNGTAGICIENTLGSDGTEDGEVAVHMGPHVFGPIIA